MNITMCRRSEYDGLMNASSHGEYFHAYIKDRYAYRRIDEPNTANNPADRGHAAREMVADAARIEGGRGWFHDRCRGRLAGAAISAGGAGKIVRDGRRRRLEILRLFVQDWALLRRGDHSAARLQLDRERLAFERKCAERAKLSDFRKWTQRPEIKRKLWPPNAAASARQRCEKSKGN